MPSGERAIPLHYGRSGYDLRLPDHWDIHILGKRAMPILPNADGAIEAAIAKPVGVAPIGPDLRAKSACILICDNTRPVPNGKILPKLVATLIGAGLTPDRIQILVATGLHDPLDDAALDDLIGDERVRRDFKVANHRARDENAHVHLGATERGTPIRLDKRFVAADLKIVVGLVEPHFMAGYSGGRKLIVPGVAAHETISHVHSYRVMADPKTANCVLAGNPLHREQLEAVAKLGLVYAINVVLDEARNLCFVNFGELVESHAQAVRFFKPYGEIPIDAPFNTVVTTSAGFPLDNSYYQTIKGMVAAVDALNTGGRMFVVSACAQGFGSPHFRDAQQRLVKFGVAGFLEDLARKPTADIDEWQTQLFTKALKKGSVCLFTDGLSDEDRRLTGAETIADLKQAVTAWVESCGDPRVAVIPEGPYVIPRLRQPGGDDS